MANNTQPMQRNYAMRKIEAGDWLLLSNDRLSLWRLKKYVEEYIGPDSLTVEHVQRWEVFRWTGRIDDEYGIAESIVDHEWDRWENMSAGLLSRKEAIDEALRLGAGET